LNIPGHSLYFAFTIINNKLFASKFFSVVLEDWVELKFIEKIEDRIIEATNHLLEPQPGVGMSFAGSVILQNTVKRIDIPENGRKGNLISGFILRCFLFFFLEIRKCGLSEEKQKYLKNLLNKKDNDENFEEIRKKKRKRSKNDLEEDN
jgi:hypothetical protein